MAFLQPDIRIAATITFAAMIPSFFIDRTMAYICLLGVTDVVFAIVGKRVIEPDVFSWELKTLIIFSLAGLLTGHMINKSRFERYVYEDSAKKLADSRADYNAELQKEVAAKTERIVALHDQLVIGMAAMVESRDNSTGGHINRTSAEAIQADSTALQLSDKFSENIIKAAPMHDLGKIAVDDAILRKPGRFTPEEFSVMKTHAAEGARIVHYILKDSDDGDFRRIAENIAHYHHERVDGSGYPDGLKGDEIPLEARIMAIADVYDALVSKRVYKDRYSFEKANQIILEGMGTQFNPGLRESYETARPKLEAFYAEASAGN